MFEVDTDYKRRKIRKHPIGTSLSIKNDEIKM